jgi:hypothetical protein
MSTVKASASFKKKDGTLALGKEAKYVSWTPSAPPGAQPEVTLTIPSITSK